VNLRQSDAIDRLLFHCGTLRPTDRVLILCDATTRDLADAFAGAARRATDGVRLMELPAVTQHGAEPPADAADAMRASTLILSLCRYSLAHSTARVDAGRSGARFLSLPLYDWELLEDPSLAVDFRAQASCVQQVARAFTTGSLARVTTAAGTDVRLGIAGRTGNACPGFVEWPGELGSPPDIEANVSPLEDRSEGTVVVDGSITHPDFALLAEPIALDVARGRVVSVRGTNRRHVGMLDELFGPADSARRVLAECGVGLNPAAKLTGTMLTDEGSLGCVHFGFGANHTVGGVNTSDFHLDFVCRAATLIVDATTVLREGVLQL
jgi:leucyl aminopeptidase (aminopeptidase T)